MFTWNKGIRGRHDSPPLPVRLVSTNYGTFQLVGGEGELVVSGTEAPELVDLVNGSKGLVWLEKGEKS